MNNLFKISLDWTLTISAILISVMGAFIIRSVNPDLLNNHITAFIIGFVLLLSLAQLNSKVLKKLWSPAYLLLVVLLLITYTQPMVRGSHRWITIGSLNIQASELGKPLLILALSGFASRFLLVNLRNVFCFLVLGLIPVVLVLKQPNLGDALLYVLIILALLFSGYIKLKHMAFLILAVGIMLPLGWNSLQSYQKNRLIAFINPQYDPQGIGYNAVQALVAVGSGKITGRGLGRGTQSHLRFLPESHTDFIFASLTEELGLAGASLLISLYGAILYKILTYAANSESAFPRLFAVGLFMQLFSQIFVNIGMNLGIVPITGVTLPLVSYGGSSIATTLASLGLLQVLSGFTQNKALKIH